jgi:hypothetical protein
MVDITVMRHQSDDAFAAKAVPACTNSRKISLNALVMSHVG